MATGDPGYCFFHNQYFPCYQCHDAVVMMGPPMLWAEDQYDSWHTSESEILECQGYDGSGVPLTESSLRCYHRSVKRKFRA